MRRFRWLTCTALIVSASAFGASASSAGVTAQTLPRSGPPAPPAISLPAPRSVAPMKPMPAGSTVKDFQAALAQHARNSGQAYAVDSSAFDPSRRPATNRAAADPDVPGYFSYLDLGSCRDRPDTEISPPGVGRIWNHWQWCGWQTHRTRSTVEDNTKIIYTGALVYRITVIGWGSQSSNVVTVRVYADQVSAPDLLEHESRSPRHDGVHQGVVVAERRQHQARDLGHP